MIPRPGVAFARNGRTGLEVAAALSAELGGISAEVTRLQADMDEVKKALGIVEGG
jgi:hypothetical protein